MADFLSTAASPTISIMSSSVTDQQLSPNSSPGASLFQDSSRFLQHLGFLDNFNSTATSSTSTNAGGFSHDGQILANSSTVSNMSSLARNSTKTLKCPKCNWHYKYQEALENHLKDKHPDVEVTCIYCIQSLPHPKLARGETYSCGYKPFRCTICNYSTTTKGNLSIHMQSDKHLHAMQDIPTTIVSGNSGSQQAHLSDDKAFHCLVCGTFTTDSIEDLFSHLNADRSQTNSNDISSVLGVYQCYLCPYNTNLKANFQLHMRTDKHIQRVQMINHMRENVIAATSPSSNLLCRLTTAKTGVQVRCRPCFEILTSNESIREHCESNSHLNRTNFIHSNSSVAAIASAVFGGGGFHSGEDEFESAMDLSFESFCCGNEESSYQCLKCDFSTNMEDMAIDHLQEHDLTTSTSPDASQSLLDRIPEDKEELIQLFEMNDARLKCDQCPDFLAVSTEELQTHLDNHSVNGFKTNSAETAESNKPLDESQAPKIEEVKCPLCDLPKEKSILESHLLDDHKITFEVAKKLMASNDIGNENDSVAAIPPPPSSTTATTTIYKFHCTFCPMVFRTNDGLQKHSLKHIFDCSHKCTRCNRSFKSVQSLRNHLANKHDIPHPDTIKDNYCSICSQTFEDRTNLQSHIYSIEHLHRAKKFLEEQSTGKLGQQLNEQVLSMLSKIPKNGTTTTNNESSKKPYKCNVCQLSYGQGSTLDIHLRSVAHQTRIGKLSELVASGEVDASLPVSEQPGGVIQKTIGELVLPSTNSEIEKLQRSESPMDVVAASTTTAKAASSTNNNNNTSSGRGNQTAAGRKRKLDVIDDSANTAAANPFAAFQNIMNMSQLFGQFTNENLENGSPMDLNNALAAISSGDLQNFLSDRLAQQQSSSAQSSLASSARASPSDETSDEPKTGRSLRHSLEADGLVLVEQFFENISSIKHNIDRIPDSAISELCKVDCPNCDTVFPSIWILKKHASETHSTSLPLEAVQQFSEKLKSILYDLEEENQSPNTKKLKIEEITNSLKAGKLNGNSSNAKVSKKQKSTSDEQQFRPNSPPLDSSSIPNLAMMSMMASGNFPMLMNPFLSMMNPEMMNTNSNGSNNNGPTASSPSDFSNLGNNQRRARTKITDDQLKVLKQYFDISNSPTEQQVKEMALKTGLAEKVIKHWFRNTLFKERQRDKDSPYNFNVPPQLSIDLDTYEKTGETKVKNVKSEDIDDVVSNVSTPVPSTPTPTPQIEIIKKEPKLSFAGSIKQEPKVSTSNNESAAAVAAVATSQAAAFVSAASEFMANLNKACNNNFNPFALLSQAAMGTNNNGSSSNNEKAFNEMLNSSTSLDLTSPLPTPTSNGGSGSGGGGSGRRANRTRFTDLQLRSLQQFFDKQAYPKDDDLELLSKKLNLSPRVIVVWFQNARQKARKIYENTPNMDNNERFTRTPGQNFQCKRCSLVFPRYYELIQHQQKVCYVNDNDAQQNDNKFVDEMMSDDEKPTTSYDNNNSSSSATVNITTGDPLNIVASRNAGSSNSPPPNQSTMEVLNQLLNGHHEENEEDDSGCKDATNSMATSDDILKFLTGKCDNATLNKFLESTTNNSKQSQQQLQFDDYASNNDELNNQAPLDLSSTSPNFLQSADESHSRRDSSANYLDTDFDFTNVLSSVSPNNLPSLISNSFFGSHASGGSPNHQQRSPSATSMSNNQHGANKRYRTHLTPLQVYIMKALFNDYKTPSMTECDILGSEIGLNKRVVQVWFQNARAKERKCRSVTGDEDLPKTGNDSCPMCGIDFNSRTPKLTMQDHIFTKRHITLLSERFNSRSASQSSNSGRHDGSMSPSNIVMTQAEHHPPERERVRARAVRDSGSRKQSSMNTNTRPSSTTPQFPFNLMYGLQSGTIPPFMCDPSIIGTPITALQIPPAVMQQITHDIQNGKDSTKFTQDGLEMNDLKGKIPDDDFKCVTTITNEVGYACPGCSNTFQQQQQLEAHQKLICSNFDGKIFKLMQIHYECIACNNRTGTQEDFKKHVESQPHQQIRSLFIQPVIENFLTTSSSSAM